MSNPKTLNFIPLPKVVFDPTLDRRAKTVARLEEQKLLLKDPTYMRTVRSYVKAEDGGKSLVEKKQRVLPFWRPHPNGGYVFFVRSGWKPIEFEKGKAGLAVQSPNELPAIIDALIRAIRGGEFDSELAVASSQLPKRKTKRAA
jgi:hypothetical protein